MYVYIYIYIYKLPILLYAALGTSPLAPQSSSQVSVAHSDQVAPHAFSAVQAHNRIHCSFPTFSALLVQATWERPDWPLPFRSSVRHSSPGMPRNVTLQGRLINTLFFF